MQVNNFIEYLDHSDKISTISEADIIPIIEAFPYCQTGQLMYTIQLNSNSSILFDEQLKKTASICSDRTKLFEYIHKENAKESSFSENKTNIESKNENLNKEKFIPVKEKDELSVLEQEYLTSAINSTILIESEEVVDPAEISEINLFDENVSHSFSSWLKYYNGDEQDSSPESKRERADRLSPAYRSARDTGRCSRADDGAIQEG